MGQGDLVGGEAAGGGTVDGRGESGPAERGWTSRTFQAEETGKLGGGGGGGKMGTVPRQQVSQEAELLREAAPWETTPHLRLSQDSS